MPKNYDVNVFYSYMKNYMDIAKRENKYVFLHTYMSFTGSDSVNNKCSSVNIDNVLKKISNEYANVFYIDMSNFHNGGYLLVDGKNYNVLFFQTLCAKLMYMRDNINNIQYNTMSWQLQVTLMQVHLQDLKKKKSIIYWSLQNREEL